MVTIDDLAVLINNRLAGSETILPGGWWLDSPPDHLAGFPYLRYTWTCDPKEYSSTVRYTQLFYVHFGVYAPIGASGVDVNALEVLLNEAFCSVGAFTAFTLATLRVDTDYVTHIIGNVDKQNVLEKLYQARDVFVLGMVAEIAVVGGTAGGSATSPGGPSQVLIAGPTGATGAAGPGVPVGGTTGEVLAKASDDDYDTEWVTVSSGTSDHATLSHLDYASAGHSGFAGTGVTNTFTSLQTFNGGVSVSGVLAAGSILINNTQTITGLNGTGFLHLTAPDINDEFSGDSNFVMSPEEGMRFFQGAQDFLALQSDQMRVEIPLHANQGIVIDGGDGTSSDPDIKFANGSNRPIIKWDQTGSFLGLGFYSNNTEIARFQDNGACYFDRFGTLAGLNLGDYYVQRGSNQKIGLGDNGDPAIELDAVNASTSFSSTVQVTGRKASVVGFVVKGAASQSADLQEWQDSAGTVLAKVTSAGVIVTDSITAGVVTVTTNSISVPSGPIVVTVGPSEPIYFDDGESNFNVSITPTTGDIAAVGNVTAKNIIARNVLYSPFDPVPLSANWSQLNFQATGSVVDVNNRILFQDTGGQGYAERLQCLYAAIPAGNWTLTACFAINWMGTGFPCIGIFVRNSGNGRIQGMVQNQRAASDNENRLAIYQWSDVNTYNGLDASVWFPTQALYCMRIRYDGTYFNFELSNNNEDWILFRQIGAGGAYATGADQCGFLINNFGSSLGDTYQAQVYHLELT